MVIQTLDAAMVQKCFLAGAGSIEAKKEYINDLNVFPVPDGDTGTNMTMTIMSAAREVIALEQPTMKDLGKAISKGSLTGARGNSGVILSQLFRGFTKEIVTVDEIDVHVVTRAFEKAVESAYRAVMKPKEGTILTVAKAGAKKAEEIEDTTEDLIEFTDQVITYMDEVLQQTPDMLPVLKEAGVVDSGGEGLVTVLRGVQDVLLGKEIDYTSLEPKKATTATTASAGADVQTDIKFGYCTEFIIMLEKSFSSEDEIHFKGYLESIGDSIVCVADDDIVKIHVHTNDPGLAIQKALTYGSLTKMKIDNMREEHNEKVIRDSEKMAAQQKEQEEPRKEVGFISVSAGDGLSEIFRGLGVDYIIEGGQTMNPSTEDVLNAISHVNADVIYIYPNNGNIILACEQAKALTEDKDIQVIPTKNIPQGISAIINYVAGATIEENVAAMREGMAYVKSGQVTYAVRDTSIDGKKIKQGDIMGLSDKTIEAVGTEIAATTIELVKKLMDDETELVTLYYGSETTKEDAEKLASLIEDVDDEIEVEVHYGGQPIYYYFISVE